MHSQTKEGKEYQEKLLLRLVRQASMIKYLPDLNKDRIDISTLRKYIILEGYGYNDNNR